MVRKAFQHRALVDIPKWVQTARLEIEAGSICLVLQLLRRSKELFCQLVLPHFLELKQLFNFESTVRNLDGPKLGNL